MCAVLFAFHRPDAFPRPRNPQLYAIADDLRVLLALHRVPDVEFVVNVDDYPKAQSLVKTSDAVEDAMDVDDCSNPERSDDELPL